MSLEFSEMSRAVRSLEVVKESKKYLPKFYQRAQERKRKQGPLAWCMAGVPTELLVAFDVNGEWPENFGALCAARLVAPVFIGIAQAEGYFGDLCSYLLNTMGYCKRCVELGTPPPESPLEGGMGAPAMLLGSGVICEPRWKWFQAIATRYFPIPIFTSDPLSPPYDADLDDPRIAEHYLTQLREDLRAQIAFLERQTGRRLDVPRLRKVMENSQKALAIWYEILELRKARPCPMGAEDYFTAIIPQLYMLGEQETVDFYEALYKEVNERVQKGRGVISDEKYRLFWSGIPPWFNLGLFNYLETLGAVVVIESTYYCGPPMEIDLEDPVEGLVQRIWKRACWHLRNGAEAMPEVCVPAGFGFIGSKTILGWVKEYHIDGALMHRTRSCRATSVGQLHFRNVLREAGVPSLIFESDMGDPRAWSDEKIKAQLEAFLEMLDKGGLGEPARSTCEGPKYRVV